MLRLAGVRALAGILAVVGLPASAAAQDKTVLVLYSNSRLLPANVEADRGLRVSIGSTGSRRVELFDEYLDEPRFGGPDYRKTFEAYLAGKYASRRPDVIVAAGATALEFLLDHRTTLFPQVPIVHLFVFRSELAAHDPLPPDVVGVPFEPAFALTIEQALRWHPRARRLIIVIGVSEQDREWEPLLRIAAAGFQARVAAEFLIGLPFDALLKRLAELPADAVVVTAGYFGDLDGRAFIPRDSVEAMARRATVPIYTPIAPLMGSGTVGGYMAPVEAIARQAGTTVNRLLDGAAPTGFTLPDTIPSALHVDWRQIQRWGIDPASIPRDAVVHFRSPTFLEEHRNETVAAALAFLAQSGLIAILLVERRRRRRAEQATERHRFELAHASRRIVAGELTASIAHEINQPLGAMLSNADAAEMILDAGTDRRGELRAILADIRRDSLRASEVIRRLRALLDKHEVERQQVDVNDAVREVEALLASEARRRRVTLDIHADADAATILADRVQIHQTLLNLLLNAMDAVGEMPNDRRVVEVWVRHTPERVHITVSDRGPGIAAESMPKLFDSFFTTKRMGMGLGLPIARSLVEAHGGRMWAENGRERGAVFHVELPLASATGTSSREQA